MDQTRDDADSYRRVEVITGELRRRYWSAAEKAHLSLEIEKLKRTLYGVRSESKQRLLDQLELQLEDAQAAATEDELAAERTASSSVVAPFERRRPVRKPFPAHLPRERVVVAAPTALHHCGERSS